MEKKKQNKENQKKKENLPYEKFLKFGPQALTESELLAIILRTGMKNKTALQLAEEVLSLSDSGGGGLLGLYDVSIDKLMKIKGIGQVKAVKVKCLTELTMRISTATARKKMSFSKPETVAQYFMERLRHRKTECVILVCLDAKGQLIKEDMLSKGTVNMSIVSPREVFLKALQEGAVSLILVHNHPSGEPTPSEADRKITQTIWEMGQKLDLPLLDHIIIGDNRYVSFKETGLL